jgi:hypothetical protein
VSDVISFSEKEDMRVRYHFGCNQEETHYLAAQIPNGVFGFTSFDLYLDKLFEMGKIEKRVFSLCLGEDGILIDHIKGGFMTIGGYNSSLIPADIGIQYVKMTSKYNYGITLKSLKVVLILVHRLITEGYYWMDIVSLLILELLILNSLLLLKGYIEYN